MPIEEMKKMYDSIGESYNRIQDIIDAAPAKLHSGMIYKITSLTEGDAFTGDFNRGQLTELKYLNSDNGIDYFKYKYDVTINFLLGYTWELMPEEPAVQECDATDL